MLIRAEDFGQNCKYFKLYEEDGTPITTSPSFDLENGFYNYFKRNEYGMIEMEDISVNPHQIRRQIKLYTKHCKFKIVDSRTGEEFTDSKSVLNKNLLLKNLE